MHTYSEHQRLVDMVRELAGLLDRRSRLLYDLARKKTIPRTIEEGSPLHATWSHVGSAFQMLAQHARSIEAEFERLRVEPPGEAHTDWT